MSARTRPPHPTYSAKSIQLVLKRACEQAGIRKHVTVHTLRHPFATGPTHRHLLENGTDIKFIQELLGHNDIKTTMRYTQVSEKSLKKIKSPLDSLG
ncbi:MAG: tyrosine-type recombinase/integrase [Spirosoma sp.]|nr:tyrosine-type recombinase/integrase [Spirosoma sp.]